MPESENSEAAEHGDAEQTFTQADVNRIVADRVSRLNDKFADYDDLKSKAARFDEVSSELDGIKQRAQLDEWRKEAAEETGAPADLLRGASLEEFTEHGKQIADAMATSKPGPVIKDSGKQPENSGGSNSVFLTELFGN